MDKESVFGKPLGRMLPKGHPGRAKMTETIRKIRKSESPATARMALSGSRGGAEKGSKMPSTHPHFQEEVSQAAAASAKAQAMREKHKGRISEEEMGEVRRRIREMGKEGSALERGFVEELSKVAKIPGKPMGRILPKPSASDPKIQFYKSKGDIEGVREAIDEAGRSAGMRSELAAGLKKSRKFLGPETARSELARLRGMSELGAKYKDVRRRSGMSPEEKKRAWKTHEARAEAKGTEAYKTQSKKEMERALKAGTVPGMSKQGMIAASLMEELKKIAKEENDMPSFLKQDRPEDVKDIYRALTRDEEQAREMKKRYGKDWKEVAARIAARQGKAGKQEQGPPYKAPIND